jgi:hypothetical protein
MDDFDFAPPTLDTFSLPAQSPFISHFKEAEQAARRETRPRKRVKLCSRPDEILASDQHPPPADQQQAKEVRKRRQRRRKTEANDSQQQEQQEQQRQQGQQGPHPPGSAAGVPPAGHRKRKADAQAKTVKRQDQRIDERKSQMALNKVVPFYRQNPHVIGSIMVPITSRQSNLCLRLLTWVVKEHSQNTQLTYYIDTMGTLFDKKPPPDHPYKSIFVDIGKSYTNALNKYGKEAFAPSQRRERVKLQFDSATHIIEAAPQADFVTSLCQLTFFWWAWEKGVIAYCWKHLETLRPLWQQWRQQKKGLPRNAGVMSPVVRTLA